MIWHLLPLPRWQSAGSGTFVPGTDDGAPFVHASPDEAVTLAVANDRFAGAAEPMVALALDESRLSAPVRREPADPAPPPGVPGGTLFPHVYGAVETSAVTEVRYARRDPSGRYISLEARPPTAEALGLLPHPEGGWFRETWRAEPSSTPAGYPGRRAAATGIYFLLPPGAESCWHTVRSDEMWLWHSGGPLTLLLGEAPVPRPIRSPSPSARTSRPASVRSTWCAAAAGNRPARPAPRRSWSAASSPPASTSPISPRSQAPADPRPFTQGISGHSSRVGSAADSSALNSENARPEGILLTRPGRSQAVRVRARGGRWAPVGRVKVTQWSGGRFLTVVEAPGGQRGSFPPQQVPPEGSIYHGFGGGVARKS